MTAPTASLADFVAAQAPVWPRVEAELRAGAKTTHWVWFVFPQIAGLGRSERARFFGLADTAAARAYLAHPVLGPRLRRAAELMLAHEGKAAARILGDTDAMKLRSCLTLFAAAAPGDPLFARALAAFYDGPDPATLALIAD